MNAPKVLMIVNPVSGGGKVGGSVDGVADALRLAGCRVTLCHTRAVGHATQIARQAEDDTHAVLAVGGDGTVREVVEGLLGRAIPVVVMPGGTENLVARHLGMGTGPPNVVATVLAGRRQPCDVGVVNGRCFIIMAGMGFDAEVVARLTERRAGHISHWTYAGPIWDTIRSHTFPAMRVEVDGATVFDDRGLVVVGLMPCYAAGLNIVRDAVLDDGLLDVCILPCRSTGRLLAHVWRMLRGAHIGRGGVIYIRGKRLRVSSAAHVPLQCDGDVAGALPADFSLLERSALFAVPPGGRPAKRVAARDF